MRMHDKDWVFLPLGGNKFRRVEVQSGITNSDGSIQIIAGLQDGDEVIGNALQLSAAAQSENPTAFQDHEKKELK